MVNTYYKILNEIASVFDMDQWDDNVKFLGVDSISDNINESFYKDDIKKFFGEIVFNITDIIWDLFCERANSMIPENYSIENYYELLISDDIIENALPQDYDGLFTYPIFKNVNTDITICSTDVPFDIELNICIRDKGYPDTDELDEIYMEINDKVIYPRDKNVCSVDIEYYVYTNGIYLAGRGQEGVPIGIWKNKDKPAKYLYNLYNLNLTLDKTKEKLKEFWNMECGTWITKILTDPIWKHE